METAITITRIDPTFWYVGMKEPIVQLMVYGHDIAQATVSTDYPGVRIKGTDRADSLNYLFVDIDLSGAQPGTMALRFALGQRSVCIAYELRRRERSGEERQGFTNADVLYLLLPDRFAKGKSGNVSIDGLKPYKIDRSEPSLRHGGNLEGIRRHLDYFTRLGVTALWFTPVLENNSPDSRRLSTYHGYATTDYYRVDPRLGTNDDYRRLVDEAHRLGLKVVMDMIFNHCSIDHPWIADLPSRDWLNTPDWLFDHKEGSSYPGPTSQGDNVFSRRHAQYVQTNYKLTPILDPYASKIDLHETTDGWFVPSMPDLNQRNPHVMKYLTQNSIWWIETIGIDGIRMDTYPYADREAMSMWMKRIETEYPNFNTVGETWVTEPAYTAAWQKDSKLTGLNSHLKTVMDFSFFDKINRAKNEETDEWTHGLNRIYNSMTYDYLYPNPSNVLAFIDNHDTDRFLGDGQDTATLKQALALLLTTNRIPQIYYGTEILMNGTRAVTDGNVRKDFPGGFPGDTANAFTRKGRTREQQAMFGWLSHLLHWRQGNDVITKGRQTQFIPYKGVYVIARQYGGRTVMTILNGTSRQASFCPVRYAEITGSTTEARNVLTGRNVNIKKKIRLAPRQTLIVEF